MRDPFFHKDQHLRRMADDEAVQRAARSVFVLKLTTGLIALALLVAIFLTWRVG